MEQSESIKAKKPLCYLFSIKYYISIALVVGLFLVGYVSARYGVAFGLAIGALPIGLFLALIGLQRPREVFYAFFVLNYFIMGMSRYAVGSEFPFGTIIDAFIVYLAFIFIVQRIFCKDNLPFKNINNRFTILSFIWLLYALFQLFNPNALTNAWAASFRGVALHMFIVSIFAPLFIAKFKDFKLLLYIWSVLTVLAVLKSIIQKFIGFDFAENYWLFVAGGNVTHVIWYGVRYFSFFTDAANFGSSMALSMTVFSMSAIFIKDKYVRIWFGIVSLLALYGMLISGTRVAIAVPFVGYGMLVLLSKKAKLIISFSCLLVLLFVFLKFTHIGSGNALVYRLRTALNVNDPSMVVRYENQAKFKAYMVDKPFGVGLGLGGYKALKYTPNSYVANIPTDSWYVMLWVETGIVGLVLNLFIMFYILGYGAYQVLFKIKNNVLKGLNIALIGGCSGMFVASYANEIIGQFPNGILIYTSLAMVYMSPKFDKELTEVKNV